PFATFTFMKIITRTIWILSIVSLFADVASEMLYPVIPVYLKEIGFSILLIGILEGVAEFTVGLSKGYFGKLSDQKGVRLPFVQLGYFLSAISKPMMGMMVYPAWIFLARTTDRLGKGVRTAARDALLSGEATRETKARVFGFHRSFDTAGAIMGPVAALAFLYFFPQQYRTLFFIAFIPGIISVALLFSLNEKPRIPQPASGGHFFSFLSYRKTASPQYRRLVTGLLLFALFNSSDVFLLLRTAEITGSEQDTIIAYIFYNLVFALASYPMGVLADKWGMRRIFIAGLILFAATYTGFAFANDSWMVFVLFLLYGLYAAATQGIAKAWITNLAHGKDTATAVGFYTSCQSICTLIASILAGLLWSNAGAAYTFAASAGMTLLVIIYFLSWKKQ
ncbi:MAG TPA: MFS transporter, partial [Chitinophagaceae bacterium]|nr:MFS transporter [Chitinophagaceae bacterium]